VPLTILFPNVNLHFLFLSSGFNITKHLVVFRKEDGTQFQRIFCCCVMSTFPLQRTFRLRMGNRPISVFRKSLVCYQFFKERPRVSCSLRTSTIQHAVYAAKHRLEMDTVAILVWSRSKQQMKQKN